MQFAALACLKALASVMPGLAGWFLTPPKTRRSPLAKWRQHAGLGGVKFNYQIWDLSPRKPGVVLLYQWAAIKITQFKILKYSDRELCWSWIKFFLADLICSFIVRVLQGLHGKLLWCCWRISSAIFLSPGRSGCMKTVTRLADVCYRNSRVPGGSWLLGGGLGKMVSVNSCPKREPGEVFAEGFRFGFLSALFCTALLWFVVLTWLQIKTLPSQSDLLSGAWSISSLTQIQCEQQTQRLLVWFSFHLA